MVDRRPGWPVGLTVGARLWLINALLATAIVVVIAQSWYTLDRHRASADRLSTLRLAQHFHRGAMASHLAAQTDIDASLRARELGMAPRQDAGGSLRKQSEQARAMLSEMEKLPLPADIREGHTRLRAGVDRYHEAASRIVAISDRDLVAALKEAPALIRDFEALATEMQAQSTAIEQRLSEAEREARDEQQRVKQRLAILGAIVILAACGIVVLIARSLRRSLHEVSSVARRIAAGEFGVRAPVPAQDELGELGDAINSMARNLEGMIERLSAKAAEDAFANQLDSALEMADSEAQACEVVAQAMKVIDAAAPMELLLTDVERLRVSRAVQHPLAGAASCAVGAPSQCVAVRRGGPQVFADSEALDACPRLRGRAMGPVSAVCVPVSFMGRSLGVLHALLPASAAPQTSCVDRLGTLGMQAGARIGTLRAIRHTQQQADTDTLTGLLNRRALERELQEVLAAGTGYAVAMADIDHFKRLNDTQGHDAGDRALRAFAELLRRRAGESARVARWGGEEFVLLLPGADATRAHAVAENLRQELGAGPLPGCQAFTASFGIADSAMAGDFDAVLGLADTALYRAKDSGRNRVVIASSAIAKPTVSTMPEAVAAPAD